MKMTSKSLFWSFRPNSSSYFSPLASSVVPVRRHQFVALRFFSTATSRSTSLALRLGGGMLVPLANAFGLDRNCLRVASVQTPSLLRSEAL